MNLNEYTYYERPDVIRLDILWINVKKNIVNIFFTAIICGILAFSMNKFITVPKYESTTRMIVLAKETTIESLADFQMASKLANDYTEIITTEPVLTDVINKLGLEVSYRELKSMLEIYNPDDTRIIRITATNKDPELVKKISDTVAEISAEYISDIMEITPPKIIEYGQLSDEKMSSNNLRNSFIGAVLGAFFCLMFIIVKFMISDSIKSEEDVKRYLDTVVLTTIPMIRTDKKKIKKYVADIAGDERKKDDIPDRIPTTKDEKMVVLKEKEYNYAYDEAIKMLRTNLKFIGKNKKVIMFSSAFPNEGKSSIALDTAIALAKINKKVVLLDADVRKSVLVTKFDNYDRVEGLSQYLSEEVPLDNVLYQTNVFGLSVIFAGETAPNAPELLEEERFSELVKLLRKKFDYVIIDTPPMANVSDGAIISESCDRAVLVIENERISGRLEEKIKNQIETTGCKVSGVVLNKVDVRSTGYYGKYGKYGKYETYAEQVKV